MSNIESEQQQPAAVVETLEAVVSQTTEVVVDEADVKTEQQPICEAAVVEEPVEVPIAAQVETIETQPTPQEVTEQPLVVSSECTRAVTATTEEVQVVVEEEAKPTEPIAETLTQEATETPAAADAVVNATVEPDTKQKKSKKSKKDKKSKTKDENTPPTTDNTQQTHQQINTGANVKRKESVGAKIKRVFTLGKSDKSKKQLIEQQANINGNYANGEVVAVVETGKDENVVVVVETVAVETAPEVVELPKEEIPVVEPVAETTTKTNGINGLSCAMEAKQEENGVCTSTENAQMVDKQHKNCIII